MNEQIRIIVNGVEEKVPVNSTISHLIEHFKRNAPMIVELNGEFVYQHKYTTAVVADGDRIEFINPIFGG